MNKLINEKLIIDSNDIFSKDDLFSLITDTLLKEKFTKNKSKLKIDLIKRENLGSTAFENGLMIPHCRSKYIKEIKLVIVNFNENNFESIDKKMTDFAVAIIVPEKAGNDHLKILSKLSKLFSTKEKLNLFKEMTPLEKVENINKIKIDDKVAEKDNTKKIKYDFVGVTSCAAGIAHTYMARDGLLDAASKLNLTAKIETRGSITENSLSAQEINDAKFVVIAADVTISKKRFSGKKLYETDTNSAIRDGISVIEKAKKQSIFYGKAEKVGILSIGGTDKKKEKALSKAIMSALSFMIPIVVTGGILMAIPNALAAGGNQTGGTWKFPNAFSAALWNFGHIGLILMVPIFAMFLAFKIGGKPAMPAALIGGFFINDGTLMAKFSVFNLPKGLDSSASAGFLGALAVGLIVGYMVRLMQWIKWHKWIKPVSNLMIVPIFSSFLTFLIITYIIGTPMTWLMIQLFIGLKAIQSGGLGASIGIGILFAALMAIDLGGPINKTTLTVATIIFTDTLASKGTTNFVPQTAVQAAISVPPLGMWLATLLFKAKFSKTELQAGAAALPMGFVGITEGALPFAFKTPGRAIISNVTGAMVAGGLVSLFQINFFGGLGSPIGAYIGFSTHNFYGLTWIISILAGASVTGIMYGLLRKKVPAYQKEHKERQLLKMKTYKEMGLNKQHEIFRHHFKKRIKNLMPTIIYCINPKNWIQNPNQDGDHEI